MRFAYIFSAAALVSQASAATTVHGAVQSDLEEITDTVPVESQSQCAGASDTGALRVLPQEPMPQTGSSAGSRPRTHAFDVEWWMAEQARIQAEYHAMYPDGLPERLLYEVRKPVIYLFPPQPTAFSVRLSLVPEWEFSAVYPVAPFETGPKGGQNVEWRGEAAPDGVLTSENGLQVSYLFWEGRIIGHGMSTSPPPSPSAAGAEFRDAETFNPSRPALSAQDSVLLPVDNITGYLDSALKALGLHTEARTSFITHWLPDLFKHKTVALRFLPQVAYERAAPLTVEPPPDVVMRVFMLFRGVPDNEAPMWAEAALRASGAAEMWRDVVAPEGGFDALADTQLYRVLEWGGMEVPT